MNKETTSTPWIDCQQQSVSFEEILRASKEGRLLILPYKVGQTLYRPQYPVGSNRMIPFAVYLSNPVSSDD